MPMFSRWSTEAKRRVREKRKKSALTTRREYRSGEEAGECDLHLAGDGYHTGNGRGGDRSRPIKGVSRGRTPNENAGKEE